RPAGPAPAAFHYGEAGRTPPARSRALRPGRSDASACAAGADIRCDRHPRMSRSPGARSWPRSFGTAWQGRIARGAIEGDARFDPVEDEGIAFGLRNADVGSGIEFQADGSAIIKFAVDNGAGTLPALRLLE